MEDRGEEDLDGDGVKEMEKITWAGVWSNLGLSAVKGGAGVYSGSACMVADAVHSLSDLISDGVTLWAVKYSRRPADDEHPYGYGKYEAIGTVGVSALLMGAAFGVASHSLSSLETVMATDFDNLALVPGPALAAAALSIGIKEWLFRATVKVGVENRSSVVIANAWHHRSDALSSVVAFVGVGASAFGMPMWDPVAGFLVSGMIAKTGLEIGYGAVKELSDSTVEESVLQTVKDCALLEKSHGGDVRDVHNVRARRMGHYTMVDLHAVVSPKLSVSAAHQAGERIRQRIREADPSISEVLVHIDPYHDASFHEEDASRLMRPHAEIEAEVRANVAKKVEEVESVASVACHFLNGVVMVQTEIVVDDALTLQEAKQIGGRVRAAILEVQDVSEADVHLELFGDLACSRLWRPNMDHEQGALGGDPAGQWHGASGPSGASGGDFPSKTRSRISIRKAMEAAKRGPAAAHPGYRRPT